MGSIYFTAVFLVGLEFSAVASRYKCGPEQKCTCYPEMVGCNLMDCSRRGFDGLGEICKNLGNATKLDAGGNKINGSLGKDDYIDGCRNLRYLSLRKNLISGLNERIQERMSYLITLDVSWNMIEIFCPTNQKIFNNLKHLEKLVLNGNPQCCQDCGHPDLSNNTELKTLYIDGLKTISFGHIFSGLSNLTSLYLSGTDGTCNIEEVPNDFFINLTQLQNLSMTFCNILEIGIHTFTQTPNLEWLDLSQNRRLGLRALYNVSYGLQFTKIKFLNYSYMHETFGLGTEVTQQDVCFLRNTSLQEIVLDGNRIQLFETNSIQLFPPTIKIIHVNDNMFTYGAYLLNLACAPHLSEYYGGNQAKSHNPPIYTNVTSDTRQPKQNNPETCIFADDEYLKNISDQIENCRFIEDGETLLFYPSFPKTLKTIVLNDCNYRFTLPNFVMTPFQNNIRYIDLSGNILDTWEGPVGPFGNLKYVDLSRNYCSNISEGFFSHFKKVENLQLHSNLIGLALPNDRYKNVFHDLVSLKTLNLSLNKITSLHPKSFEKLHSLQSLDLSFNSLDKWDIEIDHMSNLTHVNLSTNNLQSLPVSLLNHLQKVSIRRKTNFSVNLGINPLKYGCQTKDFLVWMVQHKTSFHGFHDYTFFDDSGNQLSTENIDSKIRILDKKCQSYIVWFVISSIGVSSGLSIVIGGLLYRNRWKLRYFMYMSKQRFYGYIKIPNEEPVENYRYDAFISYAEENFRFVKDRIIPRVETGGRTLCIHQRDFLPGNAIADNIIEAIKSSRKTVCLLTEAFLKRKWCIYEFNMARMESIYSRDGRSCIIIVMLEKVPTENMPMEMLDLIQRDSYLEFSSNETGEQLFWNSLVDAVKH